MKNRKIYKATTALSEAIFFVTLFSTMAFAAQSGSLPTFLTQGGTKFLAVAQYLTVIAGSAAFCFMGYALWQGGELSQYMGKCLAVVIGCIVGFHAEEMLTHFAGSASLLDYIPAPQLTEIIFESFIITILSAAFVSRRMEKSKNKQTTTTA